MAETTRNYLLGFVVFTAIILGSMSLINMFTVDNSTYADTTTYTAFNNTFNKYELLNQSAYNLQAKTEFPSFSELVKSASDLATTSTNLLVMGVNGIKFVIDGFTFITDMILELPSFIPGFPAWVSGLLVLSIIIIFSVLLIQASLNRNI